MNELIKKWLAGPRNFSYGTILYKRFGTNEQFKKLLDKGKSDFTAKKLVEEMQALENPPEEIKKPPVTSRSFEEMKSEVSDDVVLKALRDQWMPLYTEMNYCRHQLDRYLDDDSEHAMITRGQLAMKIIRLEKQCLAIWQKRDYYKANGKLPFQTTKTEIVVEDKQLGMRYKNVQGYVRRYKHLLRKDPARVAYATKLKEYEEEFKKLKAQYEAE